MATEEKRIGITDIPCSDESQDMLDMVKYVNGLETFIKNCPTPMSIAIQGDWGTGKTSTINMLQKRFSESADNKKKIKCVYFNTWQYSQFDMSDDLYISFVNSLVHKCSDSLEKTKEFLKNFLKIVKEYGYSKIADFTNLDLEKIFHQQEEKMEGVENLKKAFSELVKDTVKKLENGRLVVFIDDLDRMNPEIAVELLEVIKLFMDVENCIFVLAIDYDVVVSGVRRKYGESISEEKCRSFFDKIIQLPFRLPVESYNLNKLINETLAGNDISERNIEPLADFIIGLLGTNPRTFKRLINSYSLIKNVNESYGGKDNPQLDNVLIFGSLCIQMRVPDYYRILVLSDEDELKDLLSIKYNQDASKGSISLNENTDSDKKEIISQCAVLFSKFLQEIKPANIERAELLQCLRKVLTMTTITNVTVRNGQKGNTTKVNLLIVNGQETAVTTPTDATVQAFRQLLNDDTDLIKAYSETNSRILTEDDDKDNSYFRSDRRLFPNGKNSKIRIGLSNNTITKMTFIRNLCDFLKEHNKEAHVIWKFYDDIVFDSDN